MRRAQSSDAEFLFALRNEAEAVNWSVSRRGVSQIEHREWFAKVLFSPDHMLLIGELVPTAMGYSEPVGMVRFDGIRGQAHRVSIVVSPDYRGVGLGKTLLKDSISYWQDKIERKTVNLVAQVHRENTPSLGIFRSAGFREVGQTNGFITLALD